MAELRIEDLAISVDGKLIINGVSFGVRSGEVLALMGPNGSGKTTLFMTIAGHPRYNVVRGKVMLDGEDIIKLPPEERFLRGLNGCIPNTNRST